MFRFFSVFFIMLITPFVAYAQYGGDGLSSDPYSGEVEVIEEVDHADLVELFKLQEAIPEAERNCLRIKRNKRECRCDNGYLYKEYDGVYKKLSERHPDWDKKVLKYNFYWEGVTYEGESDMDTLMRYSNKYKALGCEDDGDKIEKK